MYTAAIPGADNIAAIARLFADDVSTFTVTEALFVAHERARAAGTLSPVDSGRPHKC
jgi:hypothetical protein